jgi:SAM-dependent methyltransferase
MKPFVGSYYIKGTLVNHYTRNAICPGCNSKIRHRLMFTFLLRHTNLLRSRVRLLHFAPEKCIGESLKKQSDIDYVSCDIEPSRYFEDTVRVDACDIQFPDESFDAVISSHVLDAIPDDTKALREIWRILRPGGWALIAIPVYGDRTFEDPSLNGEGRQRMYGAQAHQRLNGLDFKAKLVNAGFTVQIYSLDEIPGDYLDGSVTSPHIESDKYLFFARRQVAIQRKG